MTKPTLNQMIDRTAKMIVELGLKGKFPSDGQHVVVIKEVLFPKQRLTNIEAARILQMAKKDLNLP